MKTDALFYELFRTDPRSLFDLTNLDIEGEYAFESITVKTTEKRLDGFFKRTDGLGPIIFLEVQGYNDPEIYWRSFREVSTWYEQTGSDAPFVLIVLFIDKKYRPKKCPLRSAPPNRIIRLTLEDCLKSLGDTAGALTVLKPFGLSDREKLSEAAAGWKNEIDSLNLPEHKTEKLTELLEYVILQCFPKLSLKEIRKMIQLTPLEETVAGQELIQIGLEKGREEGELIGKIHMAQRFMKRSLTPKKRLLQKSTEDLKMILKKLETDLGN
ncbi:MAG: DUF2887 domain-containing protein [Desulfobacterales bacterium]|nr:DUF2887 domain-containing protein [Desulfobacterales bacterium]